MEEMEARFIGETQEKLPRSPTALGTYRRGFRRVNGSHRSAAE